MLIGWEFNVSNRLHTKVVQDFLMIDHEAIAIEAIVNNTVQIWFRLECSMYIHFPDTEDFLRLISADHVPVFFYYWKVYLSSAKKASILWLLDKAFAMSS